VSLVVFTAQYAYRGEDRFDVTRAGAERARFAGKPPEGDPFAPPRWLLNVAKKRPGSRAGIPKGAAQPPEDDAGAWAWYTEQYTVAMRQSYRKHRPAWDALLARNTVTLVCFCTDPQKCHRTILARILVALGAKYEGERTKP